MKTTGLTEAVMAQISETSKTRREIAAGVPAQHQSAVSTILGQKVKAGVVVRTGEYPRFRYALTKKATERVRQPAGACGEALRAVLQANGPLTRVGILGEMPSTFGPAQIVGSMTDGIAEGWLRSIKVDGDVCFELCADAPQIQPDPLAAAFVPFTPKQRVDQIHADLGALLKQMLGDQASPTVIHHIAAANHHLHQLHAYL